MTVKAWYWTGLGVLILSIGSSSTGRCWMEKASGVIDHLQAKTIPYMAMAEMAMGRTQAGMGHMQATQARMEAQAARLQAAQDRMEANRARLEALATRQRTRHMNVLASFNPGDDVVVQVPGVRISRDRIVVDGPQGMVVCPRTHVHVPAVDVQVPSVSVMQDPL